MSSLIPKQVGCPLCHAYAATWITDCTNPIHIEQANALIHTLEDENATLRQQLEAETIRANCASSEADRAEQQLAAAQRERNELREERNHYWKYWDEARSLCPQPSIPLTDNDVIVYLGQYARAQTQFTQQTVVIQKLENECIEQSKRINELIGQYEQKLTQVYTRIKQLEEESRQWEKLSLVKLSYTNKILKETFLRIKKQLEELEDATY